MDHLASIVTRTPQTEQADPRQDKNSAGGYSHVVDDAARLRRFLTLGVEGGTYYAEAQELAKDNAGVVLEFARERATELVAEVVAVSTAGRAPRQNPALFALAAACSLGDDEGRRTALAALPLVARTGTHLFLFARYVEQFRGWGRGLRRAVGDWYLGKSVEDLTYQVVKYRQREGWSHRDLLRLAHPVVPEHEQSRRSLFDWVCGREVGLAYTGEPGYDLGVLAGHLRATRTTDPAVVADLVRDYGLSWEMLPDAALNSPLVWEALLERGVPQTALVRQLPRLTNLGLLEPLGPWAGRVAAQLCDPEKPRKARVHPINLLVALRTYASGHGARGSLAWSPSRPVVDALDAAFYAAFGAIEPSGKRLMLALDVSGSMTSPASGLPISCREASAALALVTAATEDAYEVVGFTGDSWRRSNTVLTPLSISPRQRLDDAIRAVSNLPFGGTDCSLPMLHALKTGKQVDVFSIYTDNETYAGKMHPHEALALYRRESGIDAKLVVVAMTPTRFSIADPSDPGMLDVSGFDAAVPNLIADFARGL